MPDNQPNDGPGEDDAFSAPRASTRNVDKDVPKQLPEDPLANEAIIDNPEWEQDLVKLQLFEDKNIAILDDDLDSELPYPTRVSMDCLMEFLVFLSFLETWQILLVFLVMMVYIMTTYVVCFVLQGTGSHWEYESVLNIILDVVYTIDVVSTIAHWRLERIRKKRDLKTRPLFMIGIDVVCIILDISLMTKLDVPENGEVPLYHSFLILIVPVTRMYRPFKYFTRLTNMVGNVAIVVTLYTYFVVFVVTLHTLACFWHLFAKCESCGKNWTQAGDENVKGLDLSETLVTYIVCFYYVTCGFTSTGFGDVTPRNPYEMTYSVMVMVAGFVIMVCAFIGSLTTGQLQAFRRNSEYRTRMQLVTDAMVSRHVPDDLKASVMDFYLSFWKYKKGIGNSEMFDELPLTLKKEIQLDRYYLSFTKSIMLRGLPPAYLRTVSLKMRTELYTVDDVIYEKATPIDRMIYVIRGNIHVLSPDDNESPILTLSSGTVMGDMALLMNIQSKSAVCAATACEIQVIYKSDLFQHWNAFHDIHVEMHRRMTDRLDYAKQCVTKIRLQEARKRKKAMSTPYETYSPRRPLKILKNRLRRREKMGESQIGPTTFPFRQTFRPADTDGMYITANESSTRYDICMNTECPWILTPNTWFLVVWQYLIFVVALIVAYLYPYHAGFARQLPDSPIVWALTVMVDLLYLLDIYIQLSTALDLGQEIVTDMRKIAVVKVKQFRFILDIIAVLPTVTMSFYLNVYTDPRVGTVFVLNRLCKVHVFFIVFANLEHSLHMNIKVVRMSKYLLCLVTASYWVGTIYFMSACFSTKCRENCWYTSIKRKTPHSEFWQDNIVSYYFALDILSQTGFGEIVAIDVYEMILMCFCLIIGALLFSYLVSDYSATLMLTTLDKVAYKEIVFVMKMFMEENNITEAIQARVYVYLDLQWTIDHGYNIMHTAPFLADLPPYMAKGLQVAVRGSTLRSVPILQELGDDTIAALAGLAETYVLPPGEMVSYAGEICREFYVIEHGYCEATSVLTKREAVTLGPLDHFSSMEMLLEKPGIHIVKSLTHVKLIRISKANLNKVFALDPEIHKDLLALVDTVRNLNLVRKMNYTNTVRETQLVVTPTEPSWIKFVMSYKHLDYVQPFTNLGLFKFIRYILMARTMMPDSPFIECWEKGRAVCVILGGFIFPSLTSVRLQYGSIFYVSLILDFLALVDIYVRLHVCYYNADGLLVSHPLSTAKHYLSHGFMADLIALFPFYLFLHKRVIQNNRERVTGMLEEILRMNKIIQLYRLPSSILLFETNLARQTFLLNFLKFLPLAFIFVNVLACLTIVTTCTYWRDPNVGSITVEYDEHSWAARAQEAYPNVDMQNTVNLHITAGYFMAMTSLRIGCGDITAQNNFEMIGVIFVIIIGYMIFNYMIVIVSSSKASVNRNLTLYQERMHHLVSFMKMERIPTSIQETAVSHFEYVWHRTHGIHANTILQKCHHALRQDAMLQLYEQTISVVPAFSGVERSFVRQLAMKVEVSYYMRESPIIKKNDIVSQVYLVHRGEVDVIGPDGTIFAKMPVGSAFGNIDNVTGSRYMMTAIAAKHVDALVLPTLTLYEIAKDYPLVRNRLQVYVLQHTGYIPRKLSKDDEARNMVRRKLYKKAWFPVTYQKVRLGLVPIAYATSSLTVFSFTFREKFEWYLIAIMIILDVLMLLIRFLDYNMEYYDDSGDIVDNAAVVRHRKRHELQFLLDAISIIPIDLFSFVSRSPWYWYRILRMNRLLQARHLFLFFTTDFQRLKVNMLLTKLTSMFSSFSLTMHVLACIWYLIACGLEPNNCHKDSWVARSDCEGPYVCSLYFVVMTVTTTGFGNVRPHRVVEMTFCICISLITCLVIAVFMGDVSCIVQNYSYTLTNYDYEMSILRDYLKDGQISNPLVDRALAYVQSLWVFERGCRLPRLLAQAPTPLNEDIMVAAYGKHLFDNPVLRGCHEDLLRQICGKMSRHLFFPTNFLVQEGDCNNTMYFIQRGTVEKLSSVDSSTFTVVETLDAPECFGLREGFNPEAKLTNTYRADTIVEVLTLEYQDWKDMFVYYPAAKQHIYRKLRELYQLPHEEPIKTSLTHVVST